MLAIGNCGIRLVKGFIRNRLRYRRAASHPDRWKDRDRR